MNYIGIPGIKEKFRSECAPAITAEKIIDVVCEHLKVTMEALKTACRDKELVHARYVIFYFIRQNTALSLKRTGLLFNRDHTTVMHGLDTLNDIMDTEPAVRAQVEELGAVIKGNC